MDAYFIQQCPPDMQQVMSVSTSLSLATSHEFQSNIYSYINDLETSLVQSLSSNSQTLAQRTMELGSTRQQLSNLKSETSTKISKLETDLKDSKSREANVESALQQTKSQLEAEKNTRIQNENECIELQKEIASIKHSFLPKALATQAESVIISPRSHLFPTSSINSPTIQMQNNGNFTKTTIIVVTIVHFNKLVEQLVHTDLMLQVLKTYHDAIDTLLARYKRLEWIEWISDTCIFVSGAPEENFRHAEDCADFALALQSWSKGTEMEPILGQGARISLRVGIHSGPVTAGLVGRIPKFVLMGETVNLAARIESECGGRLCHHNL